MQQQGKSNKTRRTTVMSSDAIMFGKRLTLALITAGFLATPAHAQWLDIGGDLGGGFTGSGSIGPGGISGGIRGPGGFSGGFGPGGFGGGFGGNPGGGTNWTGGAY